LSRLKQFVLGLCVVAAVGPAAAADTVKVAVPQRGAWVNAAPDVGQIAGIFRKHGIEIEPVYTAGGGETIQAVISGGTDVGLGIGLESALGAFAKGAPLRPIANTMTGANDIYWYVPAGSALKTIQEAAGRTIAYSTTGASTHMTVLGFVNKMKIAARPVATGNPAATLTQVMSGQVDVGWGTPPFGVQEVKDGKIRILAYGSDVPGFRDQTMRITMANLTFVQTRRDVLDRFLVAYRETLDWMYSAPDALSVYAKWAGISEEIARIQRDEFYPIQTMRLDRIAGLDQAIENAVATKFLPAPLPQDRLDEFLKYYAKPK
jgi:NitT/TauT family transport system substrate-binding protein